MEGVKKLSDAEKTVMEIIWARKKAFMKDILEAYPDPKPSATTVATLLKRLQNKNAVGFTVYGNSREYYPLVEKSDYFQGEMSTMIGRFFNNSVAQFASFFTSGGQLSQKELLQLRDIIDKQIED